MLDRKVFTGGLEKMKEAMWKVDQSGKFEFSDATYDPEQGVLLGPSPNFAQLKKLILDKYQGKKITAEELRDFVIVDTAFLRSHYKRQILALLEKDEKIKVKYSGRRKIGDYPDGSEIEFS